MVSNNLLSDRLNALAYLDDYAGRNGGALRSQHESAQLLVVLIELQADRSVQLNVDDAARVLGQTTRKLTDHFAVALVQTCDQLLNTRIFA